MIEIMKNYILYIL